MVLRSGPYQVKLVSEKHPDKSIFVVHVKLFSWEYIEGHGKSNLCVIVSPKGGLDSG